MTMLFRTRHVLVFPDGLMMDLEFEPDVQEGDLIPPERYGISEGPTGHKWMVRRIEEEDPNEYPHIRSYFLEPF